MYIYTFVKYNRAEIFYKGSQASYLSSKKSIDEATCQ